MNAQQSFEHWVYSENDANSGLPYLLSGGPGGKRNAVINDKYLGSNEPIPFAAPQGNAFLVSIKMRFYKPVDLLDAAYDLTSLCSFYKHGRLSLDFGNVILDRTVSARRRRHLLAYISPEIGDRAGSIIPGNLLEFMILFWFGSPEMQSIGAKAGARDIAWRQGWVCHHEACDYENTGDAFCVSQYRI